MKNQIIVHASGKQTRTALIENGELAQLFIESPENQRTVGDIYLAEVHKVMAGIRAAFIDVGGQKDAFLHFSDIGEHLASYIQMLNGEKAFPKGAVLEKTESQDGKEPSATSEQDRLGSLLAPKQKLLVQIVKEPIGSKGPRISTDISIAGRFLVLMPFGDYVAVSKRIRSYKERRRLRGVVSKMLPDGFGVIVRTVAEKQNAEAIQEDLKDVLTKWEAILEKLKDAKPPALLHRDLDMTASLVRDLFDKEYGRVLVDDPRTYRSIKSYISRVAPNMVNRIELYKGSDHVFDHMNIAHDVESVFSPRVKMPSGGYLIFEQTEAMYVVDVNSGRYAAKKAQEENSLKTNLEAAREIAKQLRLRDIGGIIVVDFIDQREDSNRKKIYDEIKREFKKDRAKTNVLPMSDFGLMQITRQRIRPSVVKSVSKVCPMCGGSGSVVTQNTILSDIEGWITKFRYNYKYRSVELTVNPFLYSYLTSGFINQRWKWMFSYRMYLSIAKDDSISMNDYKFTLIGSDIDITDAVLMDESLDKAMKESEDGADENLKERNQLDVYHRDSRKKGKGGGKTSGRASGSETKGESGSKNQKDTKRQQDTKSKKDSSESTESSDKKSQSKSRSSSTPRKGKVNQKYYKQDQKRSSESRSAKGDSGSSKKPQEQSRQQSDTPRNKDSDDPQNEPSTSVKSDSESQKDSGSAS